MKLGPIIGGCIQFAHDLIEDNGFIVLPYGINEIRETIKQGQGGFWW